MTVVTGIPKSTGVVLGLVACGLMPEALAQDGQAPRQLEEVIVTAQKRQESLQDLSLAVSVFTESMLEAKGITNSVDLAQSTPSLLLVPQNSANTAFAVQMRGVSQSDTVLTADSPVGIYIDGVVVSKISGTLIDFIEPERIEVLRGPQGTLYGRNSTGGAVNIVTKKPSGEAGFKLQAGFGNYDSRTYRFTADSSALAVGSGDISARVALNSFERDGFGTDLTTGQDMDSRDRLAGMFSLRWRINDALMADYSYDRTKVKEAPPIAQLNTDASGLLGDFVTTERADELALSFSQPSESPVPFGIGRNKTDVTSEGHALTLEWQLGVGGVFSDLGLKSITGYRETEDNNPSDFDGTPVRWADFDITQDLETLQQEVQLIGSLSDYQINFVTGIFYYNEKGDASLPGVFGFGTVRNTTEYSMDNDAFAVYGQFDWTPGVLNERFTVTAGLRYNEEEKRLKNARTVVDAPLGAGSGLVIASVDSVSETFDNVSPTFTLGYALSDDINTYVRWSKGFKSGGFNGRGSTNEQLRTPFEDEELSAWELGLKSFWWDRRIQLNLAGYISDYQNLQVARTQAAGNGVGFATVNENIGKIEISGLELEVLAALTESLTVDLSYSYTHTDVDEFIVCIPDSPTTCVDTNVGNRKVLGLTPDDMLNVGVEYELAQGDWATVTARFDAYYQSDMLGGGQTLRVTPDSADPGYVDSYALYNARLLFSDINMGKGKLDISVWGKNLADEDGIRWANNLTETGLAIGVARYHDPRTYGIDFTYRY